MASVSASYQREPVGFTPPQGVTVTEVQVSPDLKNATAFIMPLGGVKLEETVRVLNATIGFFRHTIAQSVQLRHVPNLTFSPDRSFEHAQRINEILNDPSVAKDLDRDSD